jgi:type II secretory pathway pseudopilin PulG
MALLLLTKSDKNQTGQSITEILVALGLLSILLPALLTGFVAAREGKPQNINRMQAALYIRETQEALRSIRENSWLDLSSVDYGSPYHTKTSAGNWVLIPGTETIDEIFTREVILSQVRRDINGNIITEGGMIDPSTIEATTTVSWLLPRPSSVSSTTYLSRFPGNTTWIQTLETDFNAGELSNLVVTNNSGGEIELAQETGGDGGWFAPILSGSYNNPGNEDGLSVYYDSGYVFLGTANGGSNPDLTVLDVSDPENIVMTGAIDLGSDVYDIHVVSDYAYLATSSNNGEFMVINISNKSEPAHTAQLDLGDNRDAFAIFVMGDHAYVGKDAAGGANRELYIIDISNPEVPVQVGAYEVGDDVNGIYGSGNTLYLATSHNDKEFIILDITDPESPFEIGFFNTDARSDGKDIFVENNTAYLTTVNAGGASPEFFIIDINSPSNTSRIGSLDIKNSANSLTVIDNFAFIGGNARNEEFVVIDISNPAEPTRYGVYAVGSDVNSMFISGNYAYLATKGNDTELMVLRGGGGGTDYQLLGAFESQSFDAGQVVAFNYFTFMASEPDGTNIKLQVATSSDGTTWNYVGPDGTSASYYETESAIPLSIVEGRYFKFKIYFSSNGTATPVFEQFDVNYSP